MGFAICPQLVALQPKQKKARLPVYLTEQQIERIEKISEATGASRNAVVREIVDRGLTVVEQEVKPK
jgi:predicted DNA-binding protein